MAYAVLRLMGYVQTPRGEAIVGFLWAGSWQPDYMMYWSRSFIADGVDGLEFV